ncbi:MAG: hypothetical protein KTR35_01765 [Gammaproteobacteria bacterium]|nr:hypothetical protein [Gammaproteobacteria bacterium]
MRKLATAAAVSLALASGGVQALGLGDIEMRSSLNQPMDAEIRLTSVQPGEANGMIVKLASAEAFARAGIERYGPLSDLRFSVDAESPNPVIKISSQKPIVEPFLNFLLEVEWPQGKMVREYTVLLDPPVFMTPSATTRNESADSPAVVEATDTSLLTPTVVERDSNSAAADQFEVEIVGSAEEVTDNQVDGEVVSLEELNQGEVVALTDLSEPNLAAQAESATQNLNADLNSIPEVEIVGTTEEVSNDFDPNASQVELVGETVSLEELQPAQETPQPSATGSVTVERGDTLFNIAQDNAVAGVSPQQLMLALLAANENAFINNNINLVKAGAVLRIPTANEAQALSQNQALAQISEQNQLWQEYRDSVRSANATRLATAPEAEAEAEPVTEAEAQQAAESDSDASGELSEAAREVLENAKQEVQNRDELKIVADSEPTTTAASATADETTENDAQRLGEINRKLQLAREELASSRLETEDLGDQASELDSTSEKLDALVTLRENEVAKLEEQLQLAREQADAEEAAAAEAAGDDSDASAVEGDAEAESEAEETATSAAEAAAQAADEGASAAAAALADAAKQAAGDEGDGSNALTAAGQALEEVEVIDSDADSSAASTEAETSEAAATITPAAKGNWLDTLKSGSAGMLAIAGLGLLAVIGLLATLLFRRRNKDSDELLDFHDEVDFIDEDEAAELQAEVAVSPVDSESSSPAVAATAATGAAAATASFADADELSEPAADADDDGIDKDDTISEVDVYLAYGLHGQAEELLSKAIERDPHNQEYQIKLLETHHAQRNTEGFNTLAQNYAENFGSEGNPNWPAVANMGVDLEPGNSLYASAANEVESVGLGDYTAPKLDADDFNVESSSGSSISRQFGSENSGQNTADADSGDSLMDQSLDPAFAFDESDLEATGDFSKMSSELADETAETVELPDASEIAADIKGSTSDALDFDEALTLDEFDVGDSAKASNDVDLSAVADDLTLDLDKLSGDMELDSTELLDNELNSLEMPDLTADNELLDTDSATSAGSDEMDTMMDLAKAYIDMGDKDSASSALGEIVKSGNPAQVTEAETLLRKIS